MTKRRNVIVHIGTTRAAAWPIVSVSAACGRRELSLQVEREEPQPNGLKTWAGRPEWMKR
jgi:hypothetical protein